MSLGPSEASTLLGPSPVCEADEKVGTGATLLVIELCRGRSSFKLIGDVLSGEERGGTRDVGFCSAVTMDVLLDPLGPDVARASMDFGCNRVFERFTIFKAGTGGGA